MKRKHYYRVSQSYFMCWCWLIATQEIKNPQRSLSSHPPIKPVIIYMCVCVCVCICFIIFLNKFIYLFIYYFLAALGLCCCVRAFSSCSERGLLFVMVTGFSLQWLLLLWSTGSRHMGFSSCGTRALEPRLNCCGARV